MIEINNDSFENFIAEETEEKTPTAEEQINIQAPLKEAPKPEKAIDSDFTTEFAVDSLDAIQHTIFFALNNRKWRNRYFDSKDEFRIATKLTVLTEEEISNMENPESLKILKKKYEKFVEKMNTIDKELEFSEKQKQRLANPIKKMVVKAGYDLPPGLALVIISGQIVSERVIDLLMD